MLAAGPWAQGAAPCEMRAVLPPCQPWPMALGLEKFSWKQMDPECWEGALGNYGFPAGEKLSHHHPRMEKCR